METFWKVEAHAHTAQVSLCAKMPAEQMVHQVKDAGYDAVIVTDHYTPEFFPDNQRTFSSSPTPCTSSAWASGTWRPSSMNRSRAS